MPGLRDKPEIRRIEGHARVHETSAGQVEQPSVKTAGGDIKKCMNLETWIESFVDFCKLFKTQLTMLCVQSDRCVWVSGIGMEADPEPSGGGDKEWMNECV